MTDKYDNLVALHTAAIAAADPINALRDANPGKPSRELREENPELFNTFYTEGSTFINYIVDNFSDGVDTDEARTFALAYFNTPGKTPPFDVLDADALRAQPDVNIALVALRHSTTEGRMPYDPAHMPAYGRYVDMFKELILGQSPDRIMRDGDGDEAA